MKNFFQLLVFGLIGASFFWSCNGGGAGAANTKMETLADSMSYAVGVYLGQQIPPEDLKALNTNLISQGLRDFSTESNKLDDDQVRDVITRYTTQQQTAKKSLNLEKGQAFLEENKNKEGVMTTETGLQYKIIEEGDGPSPKADDVVKVHYTGKLLNGEVFDSSVQRGEPVEFPVGGVIPGWTEALQLMKVGGKWELYIPAELAYGERGAGQDIGPNETLIFEVELLEIIDKSETE